MDSFMHNAPSTKTADSVELRSQQQVFLGEFDLGAFFRQIWRRKALIAGTVALLSIAATIILFQIPPRYTANSQVLIESRGSSMVNIGELVAGLGVDTETIESEMEVIKSRRLAERVIDKLKLNKDPEFNAKLQPPGFFDQILDFRAYVPKEWLATVLGEEDTTLSEDEIKAKEKTAIIDAFLEKLEVNRQGFSRVISIVYTSENPNTAAKITNTLADSYILDQLEAKFEETRRTTEWLNEKISGLRQKVDDSEHAVQTFRREAGLLEGTAGPLVTEQISALNSQLIMARTARAEAEARLAQVSRLVRSAGGAGSAADVLDSPIIQSLVQQESLVKRKVAEYSQEFGERHPKMITARAELEDIQAKIATEVNKVVQGLRNEVGVAQAREATLEKNLEQVKIELGQSNNAEVRLHALQRESEADKALLETFLAQFEQKSAEQDIKSQRPDARVISYADAPSVPSFPKKKIILVLVVVASALLGVFLVFVLEQLDRGFRSGEQIEQMTGVSLLSLVPAIPATGRNKLAPPNYILERPTSAFGESIRSLHTSLLLSHVDVPPKTVVFTSAHSGEGKTTLALSMTRMLAKSGRKVILVDADLRKPTVSQFLGIATEPGLVELLAGEASLADVIRKDEPSGSDLITAGRFVPNAADIINSDQMRQMIDGLSQSYDMVIFDSPPVMAVSDARILANLVDRVVFSVRWAETRRETVVTAMKQVSMSGGKIAGVVLNIVNVKKHAQYGYGDSGYYYGRIKKYYVD
jgi:capsular exopolysaccharide synthesis family protein